ncbi:NADH dehydrogenase (ubiquinone) complex I, assembly factor 6 [Galendromus occidentalis]|uniref:15-cis-phytoene synthase n=1 Tax=Galendromus occidentalis TaxID=34638 RepID=A0AAJ6QRR3_9ACAR|nr:NADH dehydrogenase (ubiquinone) complex I, assembly factor 6 [Galendromus occidentalis]
MFRRSAKLVIQTGFPKKYSSRKSQSPAAYCADLVKKLDYENYLCTLLLKGDTRRAAFAIRAFNAELASIRDQVTNVTTSQGRFVFWRETINRIYGGVSPQHPVALELLWVLSSAQSTINKQWFSRLIESREANAKNSAFESLTATETYAESSVTPVYYLILESQGFKSIDCDHTASHLGKAQGLTNMIRAVPYHASKGHCYLPMDLMAKHGLSQERLLRAPQAGLEELLFEVAADAHLHVEKASKELKKLPRAVHDLYLPLICLQDFLERIRRAKFNIFDSGVQRRNSRLPLLLLKHKVKQKLRLWP